MHSSRLSAILTLVLVLSMIGYVARPVSGLTSCGAEPDFRITASITSLTVRAGSSNSTRLTLRSFYGFTGTVNLTATPCDRDPLVPAIEI